MSEQLRALALAATKGPWTMDIGEEGCAFPNQWPTIQSDDREVIGTEGFYGDLEEDKANAAFVAAANPAAILALLDELAELRKDANNCGSGAGCCYQAAQNERLEAELQQARAELAALRAVPAIPEPLECLHISRGSADAAADEYAAEYWAHLAQGKADADLRRGALQTVGYYVRDTLRRYQASPQAPQPTQPGG